MVKQMREDMFARREEKKGGTRYFVCHAWKVDSRLTTNSWSHVDDEFFLRWPQTVVFFFAMSTNAVDAM